jgi:hypothetical protein
MCSVSIAAAMFASGAPASIIYRDIPDVGIHAPTPRPPFGSETAQIDLDGDGVNDFQFTYSWSSAGESGDLDTVTSLGALPGVVYRQQTGQFGADKLDAGFLIQPNLDAPPIGFRAWSNGGALLTDFMNGYGWWGSGPAYLGVRIAAPGGARYGWIYMNVGSGMDIYSVAYETDIDTPIAAGAIPAPGAGVILGCLAGGAGIRRRR